MPILWNWTSSLRPWRSQAAFKHCQTKWWNNFCDRISKDFNAQNEEWTIFNIYALLSSSLGWKFVHIICITIYLRHYVLIPFPRMGRAISQNLWRPWNLRFCDSKSFDSIPEKTYCKINKLLWLQRFWFRSRENLLHDQTCTVATKVLISFQRIHIVKTKSYCEPKGFDSIPKKTYCMIHELLRLQKFWFRSRENILHDQK